MIFPKNLWKYPMARYLELEYLKFHEEIPHTNMFCIHFSADPLALQGADSDFRLGVVQDVDLPWDWGDYFLLVYYFQ